ncbi:Vacuolar protein sorting-associated protein 18 like protein [Asimina triloba]
MDQCIWINRLLLEDDRGSSGKLSLENCDSEYWSVIKEFRAFLSDCKDVLDEATTMKLLESYGRVDELVYFAGLKEHYEIVVHHYIQQGEAKKALEVLQKPSVPIELQYKFAPDLIMLDAYETIESWMTTSNLNPRRLIPAMMRYSSEPHAKNETHEVIKYLEFCVRRLLNEDPGVHNLLLSLYAKQEDESALLRFLQDKSGKGRPNGPDFFYDPKYALRLCLKEKRMRACVHIYSMMSMHEEAVALALQVDPDFAKAEADKVEDDEDLRKKLWLMVAKHVIEQEKGAKRENIRKAIAFLKETDGLLKIEDILPFFPDFSLIDDFKEAICSSLEDYNKQIEQLKQEMNDATHGADNIRKDISVLAQRFAVIDRDEECGAEYILDLQKQLSLLGNRRAADSNGTVEDETITSTTQADKIRSLLDDAIASECPFCGDLMIREISLPFILPEEADQVSSWEIKPQQSQLVNQRSLPITI